ncbi:MAG: DNA replication/repair protein RecF [Alphaproteobacteria bacterium]|nr:DNA replication/repair protein RecF [Alphaproteobacteria bacterium]
MPLRIHKINVSNFRNYTAMRLEPQGAQAVVLTGVNGAGKTNLLEAVSLMTPGRGLRGATLPDLQNCHDSAPWAIAAELETAGGLMTRIGTGPEKDGMRRTVRLNGKNAKSQSDLANIASAVWLTPQMDRLFLEGASHRRKFFDRLVTTCAPQHLTTVNRHEKSQRERMKLLREIQTPDPRWLATLEKQIAADAVAIAAARLHVLERINAHAATLHTAQSLFPRPIPTLTGDTEARIADTPAADLEEDLKTRLRTARSEDAAAGRAQHGAHRCDLDVLYGGRNMPAALCSTGEQKGLLVALILAHVLMLQAETGHTPLILLDEVAAHLDDHRRAQLFEYLAGINGQVWLTGTEPDIFTPLKNHARHFHLADGSAMLEKAVS